ncbi:MAG: hypothetical protein HW405_97 [Candidatus Berkelbacteria bacterium]|nr:hypothetical protein [Candidatus Berkelbacteria bacterium]
MLAALSTTFRLAGHKLSEGEVLSIGEQQVDDLNSVGDLAFAASEFSKGLYDDVASLSGPVRAKFLGECTETFVSAGVLGAMELVRGKGIERK